LVGCNPHPDADRQRDDCDPLKILEVRASNGLEVTPEDRVHGEHHAADDVADDGVRSRGDAKRDGVVAERGGPQQAGDRDVVDRLLDDVEHPPETHEPAVSQHLDEHAQSCSGRGWPRGYDRPEDHGLSHRPSQHAEHEAPNTEPREGQGHRHSRLNNGSANIRFRPGAKAELALEDRRGYSHESAQEEDDPEHA
jgi:hypothetical protein